jgi:FtsH-binding integral membrane protein
MNELPQRSSWMVDAPAAIGDVSRERAFIRSAYGWMFGGLLITALAAFGVATSQSMQQLIFGNRMVFFGLIIAELAAVMFLSFRINKMSSAAAAITFIAYSALNGLTLSAVLLVYTGSSVAQAFITAGGMFGAMSVYGLVTKKDLTSWGSFFMMGLIGIVIASVVNLFMHSTGLSFVISVLGVFIFVGLTAYDSQKLKTYARAGGGTNLAIIGALALYLDFVNLFLMLLRLFGDRRR